MAVRRLYCIYLLVRGCTVPQRCWCACLGQVLHEVLPHAVAAAPCNFQFVDTGIPGRGPNNACPPLTYFLDRGPWPRCWGRATGLLCRHFGTHTPPPLCALQFFTCLAPCLPAALLLLSVVDCCALLAAHEGALQRVSN